MERHNSEFSLELKGIIKKDGSNLRLYTSVDFIEYYKWLIERQVWVQMTCPMHDAHLTIVNEKIHGNLDQDKLELWDNTEIIINYSPYIYVGAQTKNYRIFMLRCQSSMLDYIADDLSASKPWHWHFTVCNLAKTNNTQLYFPKTISIK